MSYGYKTADSPLDVTTSEPIQKYGPSWNYDTQYPMTVAEQRGETLVTYQTNPSASAPEQSGAGANATTLPYSDKPQQPPFDWTSVGISGAVVLALYYMMGRAKFTISF